MSINTEEKKCPYCVVKDGIPKCSKNGYCKCNDRNCPHGSVSQDNYDD